MKITQQLLTTVLVSVVLLPGCMPKQTPTEPILEKVTEGMKAPTQAANASRVTVKDVVMSVQESDQPAQRDIAWLKKVSLSLTFYGPVSLQEVLKSISAQGINVVARVPVDAYTFSGFPIHKTDAETAFKALTSMVGLDYEVDNKNRLVIIKPMESRTWYLNLGNRFTTYSQGGISGASGSSGSMGTSSSGGMGAAGGATGGSAGMSSGAQATDDLGGSSSDMGGGSTGDTSGSSSGGAMGMSGASGGTGTGSGTKSFDAFWQSLRMEMTRRLQILIPRENTAAAVDFTPALTGNPQFNASDLANATNVGQEQPLPQAQPVVANNVARDDKKGIYRRVTIGQYSVNPETGAITVTAPDWKLKEIANYVDNIKAMYNTNITFEGELILVTTDKNQQAGLDLAGFAKFSESTGGFIQNNALGGLTITNPTANALSAAAGNPNNVNTAISGANGVAGISTPNFTGPVIGVANSDSPFRIFSAFMSQVGDVQVLQKPLISTTSGTPATFSKTVTRYYNNVNQQVAGSTTSAATATQNNLVPVKLGIILNVNPRFDVTTGLVRAQIELNQALQSGTQTIQQSLTVGNVLQYQNTDIPIVTRLTQSGEVLLHDGDLIILGGQTEEQNTFNESGLPGIDGAPIGSPVLGKTASGKQVGAYYFALRVKVDKKS